MANFVCTAVVIGPARPRLNLEWASFTDNGSGKRVA
jgi:hypothetical protein